MRTADPLEIVRARIYEDLAHAGSTAPLRFLRPVAGRVARVLGWMFLVCFRTAPGRRVFRGPYARGAAWLWPKLLGMQPSDDPVLVAAQYLRYGSVLGGLDVRVGEASTPAQVELVFPHCPFGLHDRHGVVCDDSVCTDKAIVRALGGHLEIPETIANGAPQCTFLIASPSPPPATPAA